MPISNSQLTPSLFHFRFAPLFPLFLHSPMTIFKPNLHDHPLPAIDNFMHPYILSHQMTNYQMQSFVFFSSFTTFLNHST
ncbi:uncharacterized protein Gasu_63540 [Galdieria sulphuraria]|uniref:Uncharacterized protein n=1 Tax=Galdieria sulphuraria TaxID=130081 RepID=M2XQS7_GALSU|nr:uncharacterized protein Gasu_63540 [Galdieria sulphuraria]EME25988.1 hypothetical protein Gasu_63540 [Galdieria sulphuraria]|eukprot:XP_005702508.1 hypothetical protein Gasu_63540 [Galdieria sulphuraria]